MQNADFGRAGRGISTLQGKRTIISHPVCYIIMSSPPGNTIRTLRARFQPSASPREAAQFMVKVIRDCFLSKWSKSYDIIQYYQQNIPYY